MPNDFPQLNEKCLEKRVIHTHVYQITKMSV